MQHITTKAPQDKPWKDRRSWKDLRPCSPVCSSKTYNMLITKSTAAVRKPNMNPRFMDINNRTVSSERTLGVLKRIEVMNVSNYNEHNSYNEHN